MKKSELIFAAALVPLDFVAILAAGVAAYYARFHPVFTDIRPVIFDLTIEQYFNVILPVAVLCIGIFAVAGLYAIHQHRLLKELTRVFLASSASMAVVFGVLFFSRALFESRFIVLAAWILAIIFLSAERIAVRGLQRSLLAFGIGEHRVVVIGKNKTSDALVQEFQNKHRLGFHIVAQYKNFSPAIEKKILDMKKRYGVDEILLADSEASQEEALAILAFSENQHVTLKYSADLFPATAGRTEIVTYAGIPIIEVKKTPLDGWGAIYKRIFDIVVSLILIIATLPIQIVVGIALFIEQPGRVFFSRLPDNKKTMRIGQGGEPFHYFKFRSMIKDAHKYRFDPEFVKKHGNMREGTPLFKLKDDPRVTPVGKFIRKFSLDELPEFYLVFMGRMSMVGPRPHLPEEVDNYLPHQRKVLTVKPGITGLAQISGRADLDFEDEVRLDIHYLEHWSPILDLYIIFKTPIVVLFRKGAY